MTALDEQVIRLSDITKVFKTDEVETHAVSAVSLNVKRGEFVSVAGPSGSGKTTLLSIIGLLDAPTSGTYWLNGKSVASLTPDETATIRNLEVGLIFQSFNLIGDLTVEENVTLPLSYRGWSASQRRKKALEVLEIVGLLHRRSHYPSSLSGGQQQRVAVARAISGTPSILLADEPTGNLDSRNAQSIMELLCGLHQQGTTILMVTHDARFASAADRTIHLFDGRLERETFPSAAERDFALAVENTA
jgi:putative ABC transport system ATP-binding protein